MLGGSGFCRILPCSDSRSAGQNRDLPTRPRFYPSATCGFVAKNLVVLGKFRFFPALPENVASIVRSNIKRSSATTSSCRGNIKGPLPETEQRPFFVIASRRVRDDCITENILPSRQATQQRDDWQRGRSSQIPSK